MLVSLSIDNVAVIERAEAEFDDGFNVLTGETGAGKSILIDALSMVLGMRTTREIVRGGASAAQVCALFSPSPDLSDLGIEEEEDGSVLLSRVLHSDGRSICRINSRTVSLSVLRAAGERLVSIHGQNENLLLLKPSFRLALLDEFAGCGEELAAYREAYKRYVSAKKALDDASFSESEREMKKDMLSFRIDEITAASPKEGEDEALAARREALRSFSSIKLALESAREALAADGGAKDLLYRAMRELSEAARYDNSLKEIAERMTDLYYCAEDAASEISEKTSSQTFSPEELDEVEARLDTLTRLKKKYGPTLSDCLKNFALWQEELEGLCDYEENISRLSEKAEEAKRQMFSSGAALEAAREAGGENLSEKVCGTLDFLDMPKVRFAVAFTECEPSESGLRSVDFMISTSPSEPLRPLAKIASGGEMSRIMLAIKSALSSARDVGVLLFDEIDSGVSGRAAVKIAVKLKELADKRQVICVTHLPQLAARADRHLLVSKDTSTESFKTRVDFLDRDGRIAELSRLISGGDGASSRAAAEEMLSGAG